MNDRDCVDFLRWATPKLSMRWEGFRKVRGQVCKRVERRITELKLNSVSEYRDYLLKKREKWDTLDSLMRITISRFYRDKAVYDCLLQNVAPSIIRSSLLSGDKEVRAWSIGCASGEEPYTLSLIWALGLKDLAPDVRLCVIATDSDANMIRRAREGRYKWSGLKDLPRGWVEKAFNCTEDEFIPKKEYREGIEFYEQDVRYEVPDITFHLVLCRNLVFTYFDESLQKMVLERILTRLLPGGYLVIGIHESLPCDVKKLDSTLKDLGIYKMADCPIP